MVKLSLLISFAASFLSGVHAWTTENGQVYDTKGHPFHIRGCSWFGFETQDFVINGLWQHPMEFYVDILSEVGVTAVRIPFSAEWAVYNWDVYPYDGILSADPSNSHLMSREVLGRLFDLLHDRGIMVMLDLHRLHKEYISELWYSPTDGMYTQDQFFQAWFTILDEFHTRPNLMAVDLLNEPHGQATWGSGDPSSDWRLFAEDAIATIQERYPNSTWLYLVEGVQWGRWLGDAGAFPVVSVAPTRVAYSPHQYGASVVPGTPIYDVDGLRRDWETSFGYLRDEGWAVIPGEWGGRTDIDTVWMNHWTDYLIDKNMTNNFFWSLGPNSGDVAGLLLDDWTTVDQFKAGIIAKLG